MIYFDLQHVNEAALRRKGADLGIPGASSMNKDPLIDEIKKKLSPEKSLILSPLKWSGEPAPGKGMLISTVVATASAIGALITALLTYSIANSTTEAAKASSGLYQAELVKMREATDKDLAERHEKMKEVWKKVIVHKIIEDRYATQKYGLNSKDDIRRNGSNLQIAYAVLNVLSKESEAGKYTMPEVIQLLMEKVKGSTHEEVNAVLTEFVAKKYILVGEDRKLWSASHPPKKKVP